MAHRRLTRLPAALERFVGLRRLTLRGNRLFTFPPEVLRLPRLRELDLAHNKLAALPESIVRMAHLRRLDVSHNLLCLPDADPCAGRYVPERLFTAPSLDWLHLGGNAIDAGWRAHLGAKAGLGFVDVEWGPPACGDDRSAAPQFASAAVEAAVARSTADARAGRWVAASIALAVRPQGRVDAAEIFLCRGKQLQRAKQYDAALVALNCGSEAAAGLVHAPSAVRLLALLTYQRAKCLLARGDRQGAAQAFAEAEPWLHLALRQLGWAPEARADLQANLGFARSAISDWPGAVHVLRLAAEQFVIQGRPGRAANALHLAGVDLLVGGQHSLALEPLGQALRLRPAAADM